MLKKFIDEIAVIYSMATMPLRWLEGRGFAIRYLRKNPYHIQKAKLMEKLNRQVRNKF